MFGKKEFLKRRKIRKKLEGTNIGAWFIVSYEKRCNYLCRCVCGKEKLVSTRSLNSGDSRSCGCQAVKFRAETAKAEKEPTTKPKTILRKAEKTEPDYA